MARFDVYRFSADVPFVLEVQADILSDLDSVVVVPLLPIASDQNLELPRLCPVIRLSGEDFILMTTDIAGISRTKLGPKVGSLADQRAIVVDAVDFLLQGF